MTASLFSYLLSFFFSAFFFIAFNIIGDFQTYIFQPISHKKK